MGKAYFNMSPFNCMLLAALFRSKGTVPINSLNIQIIQIAQNSLPVAVEVRVGSPFQLSL